MIETIRSSADLHALPPSMIPALCAEIREIILDSVSVHGGHLASNLGIVETTVALHRVFSTPHDALIFDVGHQCYAHKILTGRREGFSSLRTFGGMSGFPSRDESEHDPFTTGHSGTALSAALGMAEANRLAGSDAWVTAIIGDGSFSNGMVYEAMNSAAKRGLRLMIVLNDNEMSISRNVGGMSDYFSKIRLSRGYFRFKRMVKQCCSRIPVLGRAAIRAAIWSKELIKRTLNQKNIFECMGLEYLGPADGTDEAQLEAVFREAKDCDVPCIVHILTRKGNGYLPAEEEPALYHAVSPFSLACGVLPSDAPTFSRAFGEAMCAIAEEDPRVCAITAAMRDGTGLTDFSEQYRSRFFDVGIAEEHAITFAAGLARSGMRPVTVLYSTFAQRSFDQLLHDAALQKLPLVLALDRCGIVPGDGATHQGIFDVGLFTPIPGVRVLAAENYDEVYEMLSDAIRSDGVTILRYPRGSEIAYDRTIWQKGEQIEFADFGQTGEPIVLFGYGRHIAQVLQAADVLCEFGYRVRVVRLRQIWPLPADEMYRVIENASRCYFAEEGIRRGGIGEAAAALFAESEHAVPFRILAAEDFVRHGDAASLLAALSLDGEGIARAVHGGDLIPEDEKTFPLDSSGSV